MKKLKNLLNIEYNVIQGPMSFDRLPIETIAKISENGFLGSIASGFQGLDSFEQKLKKVRSITNKPVMANYLIDYLPRDGITITQKTSRIINIEKMLGIHNRVDVEVPATISQQQFVELVVKYKIPIVSCIFGFFDPEIVDLLHANGIQIMATATDFEMYQYLKNKGADAIVVQGNRAIGVLQPFLSDKPKLYSTYQLLQEIRKIDKDTILIAAGGISLENMVDYYECGADYIQLGTSFMLTDEAGLSEKARKYIEERGGITEEVKTLTGFFTRGVVNSLIRDLSGSDTLTFPQQYFITKDIVEYASSVDDPEYMALFVGSQVVGWQVQPFKDLVDGIKNQCKNFMLQASLS